MIPETKATATPSPDNDNDKPVAAAAPTIWSRALRIPKRIAHIVDRFLHEINHDHKFWVNALGMKGGAGTAVLAGTFGVTYALTFPFAIAATLVAGCAALIGLGVFAAVSGFGTFSEKARAAYRKARGLPPPPPKPEGHQSLLKKIGKSPFISSIINSKPMRAIAHSKPWRMTTKIVQQQQNNVLSGFAVGGALLSTTLGAWVLAAQVVVLPVVALGSLITLASVWAISTIASGVMGTFFSIKNVAKLRREKKAEAVQAKSTPALSGAASTIDAPQEIAKEITGSFQEVAKAHDNDNASPSPLPQTKAKTDLSAKKPSG